MKTKDAGNQPPLPRHLTMAFGALKPGDPFRNGDGRAVYIKADFEARSSGVSALCLANGGPILLGPEVIVTRVHGTFEEEKIARPMLRDIGTVYEFPEETETERAEAYTRLQHANWRED